MHGQFQQQTEPETSFEASHLSISETHTLCWWENKNEELSLHETRNCKIMSDFFVETRFARFAIEEHSPLSFTFLSI